MEGVLDPGGRIELGRGPELVGDQGLDQADVLLVELEDRRSAARPTDRTVEDRGGGRLPGAGAQGGQAAPAAAGVGRDDLALEIGVLDRRAQEGAARGGRGQAGEQRRARTARLPGQAGQEGRVALQLVER